jgi:hypothetical protein
MLNKDYKPEMSVRLRSVRLTRLFSNERSEMRRNSGDDDDDRKQFV